MEDLAVDPVLPEDGGDPEELEIGLSLSSAELIIPQLRLVSLTSRRIAIDSLLGLCASGPTEELQALVKEGLFPLLLTHFSAENLPIIGEIATSFSRLSALFPDDFAAIVREIPISFLLSVPGSPEIIEFFQNCAVLSEEFAAVLISVGEAFVESVNSWLQTNENLAKPTLELLSTLADIPGAPIDFSFVKPLIDNWFPIDIRALALEILIKVEEENAMGYIKGLLELFYQEKVTSTLIQVVHDVCLLVPEAVAAEQIFARAVELLEIPDAAILIADVAQGLTQVQREEGVTRILEHAPLCIERADSVFRICREGVRLPREMLAQFATELSGEGGEELLGCVEAILELHPEFFADAEGQQKLCEGLVNDSVNAFRLCLKCCANVQVDPQLLRAFGEFAENADEDLDAEIREEVMNFVAHHQ
jgi:hypothetical protein